MKKVERILRKVIVTALLFLGIGIPIHFLREVSNINLLLGQALFWILYLVLLAIFVYMVLADYNRGSLKRMRVVFFGSTLFYIAAFLYIAITNALNGYIVIIPALLSVLTIVIITVLALLRRANFIRSIGKEWAFFLFTFLFSVLTIMIWPK